MIRAAVSAYAIDAELIAHFADALRYSGILLITFPNRRGLLQSTNWMFAKRSEYLQYRTRTYTTRQVRTLLARHIEVLEAKSSIGLPILRHLGAGELIVAVGRKRPIHAIADDHEFLVDDQL